MAKRRPKATSKKERPKLTYRVGLAIARLTRELLAGKRITWEELAADLAGGIEDGTAADTAVRKKEKTAKRYLAALREELFIGGDVPLLRLLDRESRELVPSGEKNKIPLNRIREAELVRTRERDLDDEDDSPIADVLPQYLAFAILQLLESVLPKAEIQELWERQVGKQVALGQNAALRNFHRKFLAIPFGEKLYNRRSSDRVLLDSIVDALVNDRRIRAEYRSSGGKIHEHLLEPLSLATYKSGLYLVAQVPGKKSPGVFAVDRFENIETVRSDDGTPEKFSYPTEKDYDPVGLFGESFGIFIDPERKKTKIRLLIHDAKIAERMEERSFHETQQITKRADGRFEMTMTVTGATEVEPWVLSWGPLVTLLEPADMRNRIKEQLAQAVTRYDGR